MIQAGSRSLPKGRRGVRWVARAVGFALLGIAAVAGATVGLEAQGRQPLTGRVVRVMDGDTIAVRTGVPVVPIAVNSGEFWPRRKFVLRPGVITVSIGPAIASEGKSAEQLSQEVEGWIESEMRRLSPHLYRDATPGATKDPIA